MCCMASVSLDHEVMFIGKNINIIIILHSNAGGRDVGQYRREILSYKEGKWTEVGLLVIGRSDSAATKILVNTTVCD